MRLAATLFAVLLPLLEPAPVKEWGHCEDVTSAMCPVRDYWPRGSRMTSVGQDAYWAADRYGRVCFIPNAVYGTLYVGKQLDCVWREKTP